MLPPIASTTFVLAGALILAACGGGDAASPVSPSAGDGPVAVGATLPLFADFVRAVGGGRVAPPVPPLPPAAGDARVAGGPRLPLFGASPRAVGGDRVDVFAILPSG